MSNNPDGERDRWSFSLWRLVVAIGLFGVALACGRALATMHTGASTAYLGAAVFLGMGSAASAALGALTGKTRQWALIGLVAALPFAAILVFLFRVSEV